MADKHIREAVGKAPAPNHASDQQVVQDLLNAIPEWAFGAEGTLTKPPVNKIISDELQDAIDNFQSFNVMGPHQDGRVSPGGETLKQLNKLAQHTWIPRYEFRVPLYGQRAMTELGTTAAENACWWACIKMVAHTHALPVLHPPDELVNAKEALNNMALEHIYPRYRMDAVSQYKSTDWTGAELIQALKENGPLVAYGRFQKHPSPDHKDMNHAIVVWGVYMVKGPTAQVIVEYSDPWEPKDGIMILEEFNAKVHHGHYAVAAYRDNRHIHWYAVNAAP